MPVLQVVAGLKKGRKGSSEHLLRLGSALEVNRSHLLACGSAQEGLDRSLISPRPCSEGGADGAAHALHDSPDSLHASEEPATALSRAAVPVMLQHQLAAEAAAEQLDQATQLGAFQWDRLEQRRQSDSASAYETASAVDSGESVCSAASEVNLNLPHSGL